MLTVSKETGAVCCGVGKEGGVRERVRFYRQRIGGEVGCNREGWRCSAVQRLRFEGRTTDEG